MSKIISIDPGASGGIAWRDNEGQIHCVPMPKTEGDTLEQLREIGFVNARCYIEEVGGFCGVGQPGSAMFKFGRGFGFVIGVMMASYVRVDLVKPQAWQKHFGFGTIKEAGGKTAWKNKLKARAQQLYPNQSVTLKTADALLILEYGCKQAAL